jgi:hypothetical protein
LASNINYTIGHAGREAFNLDIIPSWMGDSKPTESCCFKAMRPTATLILGGIPLINLYVLKTLICNAHIYRKSWKLLEGHNEEAATLYKAMFYSTIMNIMAIAAIAIGITLFIVAACHEGIVADNLNYAGAAFSAFSLFNLVADTYYYRCPFRRELIDAARNLPSPATLMGVTIHVINNP